MCEHFCIVCAFFVHIALRAFAKRALVAQALLAEDVLARPHDHHFIRDRIAQTAIKVLIHYVFHSRNCWHQLTGPARKVLQRFILFIENFEVVFAVKAGQLISFLFSCLQQMVNLIQLFHILMLEYVDLLRLSSDTYVDCVE